MNDSAVEAVANSDGSNLEGGYTPELIAVAAENVVSALLGIPKPEPGELGTERKLPK